MLTETEKTKIAELVRKIMDTPLPANVSSDMFNAFYNWPTYGDYSEDSDGQVVIRIVDHEVLAQDRRDLLPPWLQ